MGGKIQVMLTIMIYIEFLINWNLNYLRLWIHSIFNTFSFNYCKLRRFASFLCPPLMTSNTCFDFFQWFSWCVLKCVLYCDQSPRFHIHNMWHDQQCVCVLFMLFLCESYLFFFIIFATLNSIQGTYINLFICCSGFLHQNKSLI